METPEYMSVILKDAVQINVNASNKEEVFHHAANLLYNTGILSSKEAFIKDLYYRESLGATGIGGGVAIPHGKSKAVSKTCISILKLEHPIPWETADDRPVQVLILFAVSEKDRSNTALKLMSQIARKLVKEGVCENLVSANNIEELMSALV